MTTPTLLPERIWLELDDDGNADISRVFLVGDGTGAVEPPSDVEYVRADIASSIAGVPAQRAAKRIVEHIGVFNSLGGIKVDLPPVENVAALIEEEYSRGIAGQAEQDQG